MINLIKFFLFGKSYDEVGRSKNDGSLCKLIEKFTDLWEDQEKGKFQEVFEIFIW